ncbi:MAG: N-6 DNA methylase [Coriobacteriales bacterium]|nr:N-6 DNA methylase [Coriobacteriales bacterium]
MDPDDAWAFVAHADAGNFAIMRESVTPSPIVVVATEVLEIADGEEVADYGCGQGFFLAYAASRHPGATYVGYEVNPTAAAVAALRMHALKLDDIVSVQVTDLFDFADSGPEYDKVFSHYPIGMRFPRIQSDSAWLREVASGGAGYGRPVVFDWVFNQLVIDTLRDGGMGVVLMSDGALVNVSDEGVRAGFVESGWIRNVVKLPRNMLHDTSAGCNLVVLASGCGDVHFLDVTGLAVEGRRKNTLSDKAVEVIATYVRDETYDEEAERKQHPELFDEEKGFRPVTVACRKIVRVGDWDFFNLSKGVHSCTASAGAIASARYKLDMKYLDNTIGYDGYDMACDPDELGEHVVSINRGVTLKASELDDMTVTYDTGVRYLAPTGIEDGLVRDDLPFLSELTPKLQKHALRSGDLLISRIGQPYRIAVADVPEGTIIVPSSNIFVVRVNPEDIDPYYLAAYLQSSRGMWELDRASSGGAVLSISAKTLREVEIPYLEPYETEDVVWSYQSKLEEIRLTKERLERARKDLQDLLD